jgi:hypothetical protein
MNASILSFLEALPGQGILHQSQYWNIDKQYLSAGLMLKAATTLVSVRKLSYENRSADSEAVCCVYGQL